MHFKTQTTQTCLSEPEGKAHAVNLMHRQSYQCCQLSWSQLKDCDKWTNIEHHRTC